MNTVTIDLENAFKSFATNLNWVMNEAKDIHTTYFATDASTLINALATSGTGASLDTKLTKAQYTNGIGFLEQLNNFFGNAAVTQGDYMNTLQNLIYGNAASPAKVSDAAESLANRMKVLAASCVSHFLSAKDLLGIFNNSELAEVIANISGARIVYGANMSVTQMTAGITLVEQYKKLINNEVVATGDYGVTIAQWKMV